MAVGDVMGRVSPGVRHDARGGLEALARFGYAAKGAVYAIVAVLALKLALGQSGGRATDQRGALDAVAQGPFGKVLLVLLGIGLAGYALWRVVQAVKNTEGLEPDAKGKLTRAGIFGSGLLHAGLAVLALERALGKRGSSGSGGSGQREWTAKLLDLPFGRILVALVALALAGMAFAELRKAWKRTFERKLDLSGPAARHAPRLLGLSRFGIAARAVVFLMMAYFFLRAAIDANAGEVRGFGEALGTLARQPLGPVLLGIVAAGLLAYALYLVIEARYRRLAVPVR